jgi:predicted outer membrane protein
MQTRFQCFAVSSVSPRWRHGRQRMIDDHTKVNDRLKSVVERKGMTVP